MEIFHGILAFSRTFSEPVLTIGNFDGVHLGHQAILRQAVEQAKLRGGAAIGYTFWPHPQSVLRPDRPLSLLTTREEKLELLAASGLDALIEEPFTAEFAATPAERFFTECVQSRIQAKAIVVGYDFAFGRERGGTLDSLSRFCRTAGLLLTVVPPQSVAAQLTQGSDEDVASSSRIRGLLSAGDVKGGARLLGRPFSYRGTVERGEARGRQLGFPTVNFMMNKLRLPHGVYATRVRFPEDPARALAAVTNIGVRPTFGPGAEPLVETHLLDFSGDVYGRTLQVDFIERLREERKFGGVAELKAQIARDVEQARSILSRVVAV